MKDGSGGVPPLPASGKHVQGGNDRIMADKPLIAITGASSGIGEATARAFSAAGHPVLMMARRVDRMEAMNLPDAVIAEVDVRDRSQIAAAVAKAEAQYGPVDMMS